jgi:hypothetical protein
MTGVFGPENYCHSCGVNCDNGWTFGPCVRDRGPAVPMFGIKDWKEEDKMSLQENFYKVAYGTEAYINNNKVSLGCFTPNGGQSIVDPGPAAQKALDKLCNLNTDDISISNVLSCLGAGNSIYSRMLGTRYAKISMSTLKTGGSISYNLSDITDNLPLGYTVTNIKSEVFAQNPGNVYDSRIASHKQTTGQFILNADQFPAIMEISMDVGTPGGLVTLTRKVPLSSQKNETFNVVMDIEDRTSTKGFGMTQTEFNELLESAYCNVRNMIDSLRTVAVSGCNDMQHSSQDIRDVVATHDGHICKVYDRLNNIGNEKILGTICELNCEERTYETTIQKWATEKDNKDCDHSNRISVLESKIRELEQRLTICCEMKSVQDLSGAGTGSSNAQGTSGLVSSNSSSNSGSSSNGANNATNGSSSNGGSNSNGGSSNGGSNNSDNTSNGGGSNSGGSNGDRDDTSNNGPTSSGQGGNTDGNGSENTNNLGDIGSITIVPQK